MNKCEIKENLQLAGEYYEGVARDVILLGGAAMVLHGVETKVTEDIDAISGLEGAEHHFEMFAINDHAKEVVVLPEGYMERIVHITTVGNVRFFILGREDIVFTKLLRGDDKDIEDIEMSGWLDDIERTAITDLSVFATFPELYLSALSRLA